MSSYPGKGEGSTAEWGWTDRPIFLPVTYDMREWNAAFIASSMAAYSGGGLVLFCVSTPDSSPDPAFRGELQSLLSRLGVKADVVMRRSEGESSDSVARAIVEEAERRGAQTIVMAARKQSVFGHVIGGVPDRVARRSPIRTILVGTSRAGARIPASVRKIIVLVKSGKESKDAFMVAAALASLGTPGGAELVAAHAIVLPRTVPLDAVKFSDDIKPMEREFANSVSESIKNLGRPFTPRVLVARQLGTDVGSFVAQEGGDMVVLSGRRSSPLAAIFGKDTEDIVRSSPCTTLVVFAAK
ncbi:MAG: universal stress protein [Nitrososphaerota archaeon]|nr:universal stress protein [Nitrososphaerota archaeon]MDG6938790.1 universal stress protein [Nitrososphaerota archaeon]